jgi:hypothetical protein
MAAVEAGAKGCDKYYPADEQYPCSLFISKEALNITGRYKTRLNSLQRCSRQQALARHVQQTKHLSGANGNPSLPLSACKLA